MHSYYKEKKGIKKGRYFCRTLYFKFFLSFSTIFGELEIIAKYLLNNQINVRKSIPNVVKNTLIFYKAATIDRTAACRFV